MWQITTQYGDENFYAVLEKELLALIDGEENLIANLANISAWINHSYPGLNWCGFYLWHEDDQELVLGPFQGKPACIRIKPHQGVCGAAYTQGTSLRVKDVHAYPGHIACDSASLSELVIPLLKEGKVMGVLDMDSPFENKFSELDEREFTRIMNLISERMY